MIGGSQPISNDICDGEERGEMEREMREGSEERKVRQGGGSEGGREGGDSLREERQKGWRERRSGRRGMGETSRR